MEKIYKCIIIALLFLVLVFGGSTIFYARKSNESGRLCNQLRERLSDATDTNRRLTETVEQCQFIVTELGSTTDRNITTARAAVEVIEEVRIQVQSLEMELGGFNSDDYYSHWDSVFGLQQ